MSPPVRLWCIRRRPAPRSTSFPGSPSRFRLSPPCRSIMRFARDPRRFCFCSRGSSPRAKRAALILFPTAAVLPRLFRNILWASVAAFSIPSGSRPQLFKSGGSIGFPCSEIFRASSLSWPRIRIAQSVLAPAIPFVWNVDCSASARFPVALSAPGPSFRELQLTRTSTSVFASPTRLARDCIRVRALASRLGAAPALRTQFLRRLFLIGQSIRQSCDKSPRITPRD